MKHVHTRQRMPNYNKRGPYVGVFKSEETVCAFYTKICVCVHRLFRLQS